MTIDARQDLDLPRGSSPSRRVCRIGPLLGVLLLLGAGPPGEVRVRVPAAKVGSCFPAGTELRGMPADEFEALMTSARAGHERRAGPPPARLLRAHHQARWDEGRLVGRSELVAESPVPGGSEMVLAPWTPAIDPPEGSSTALRMHDDGRTALRLDSTEPTTTALSWQLRARPNSRGKAFHLGLPASETSTLRLDLPEGWVPEGLEGVVLGPSPADEPGRATWRFEGRGGLVELHLSPRADGAAREPRVWVSGPTRIELQESSASWTMEWMVALDPRGPRRFVVELDEGLEFLGASGPAVEAARAGSAGGRTRVTVVIGEQVSGPTPVTFTAIARVPAEGAWAVPAARPIDAQWTGGKTSVRLDPSRVVKECRERSGRRVSSRPGEAADPNQLLFEADAPGPVAVLVFGRPRAEVSVEVRGQLLLGNSAPRLECQLTWRVHRGRLLALDVDLPPAWVPERLSALGIDETLAWHPSALPGGGVRVHVAPPSGDFARSSLTLNVTATASIAGGRGSILLPRVRPVGGQVVDERWLAWTESGVTLHTESARGLAWIDPSLVIGPATRRLESPAGLREALAWRWISEQAEARVERDRAPSEPSGSVDLLAIVERDRLRLDWKISVDAGEEPLRSIPLAVAEPMADLGRWRFTDEATDLELPRRPLSAARRAELGFPGTGEAWELAVPDSASGPVVIRSRLERPWNGQGRLPLLVLPERFRSRNFVVIDVARNLRALAESAGLQELDPGIVAASVGIAERREDLQAGPTRTRRDYAFGYSRPGGRLELRTETLEPVRTDGVIDQAVLTTTFDPHGPCRHRLMLRVAVADAQSLDLTLPAGSSLIRVRRDGQAIAPTRSARGLSLPLTSPSPSRLFCTFVLDYLTPPRPGADGRTLRPERPFTSLPCLALRWEIVAPEPWAIADHGANLIASDPIPARGWLGSVVDPWRSAWRAPAQGPSRRATEVLQWLDSRVAGVPAGEMTLGEWLTRWDIGPWPVVVDRMALETAGWGPRSRVTSPRAEAGRPGAARAALQPLGLAVVPIGDWVVVTTRTEEPDRPGGPLGGPEAAPVWETRLRDATLWGSDASDRFQSVARWRGEHTPKFQVSGETTEFEPVGEGWRIRRFAASGWPESGATVRLIDERSAAAWGWAAGLAVLALGVAGRGLDPRRRAVGLAVGLLGLWVAVGLVPAAGRPAAAGALGGALAVLFFWVGGSLLRRPGSPPREARTASSLRLRPSRSGLASGLLLGLAFTGAGSLAQNTPARPESTAPVVALFPYDGVPDPDRAPDRVVIRLEDYARLQTLAGAAERAPSPSLAALSAVHTVTRQGDAEARIETDLVLLEEGPGPAAWTFPIDHARDITATLDDTPAPVLVRPGARSASVPIAGRGRTRLRIRRVVTLIRDEDGDRLSLPINPLASARIEVRPGRAGDRVEVPSARGGLETEGGSASGVLGPADRLEVRWQRDGKHGRPAPAAAVEGLLLWDAEPAGDRVRARLTYRNPKGTSVVRLLLEPGLVVRSSTIPGLLDTTVQTRDRGSEWIASVDPPLPDGSTIRLDLWRPHAIGRDLRELPEDPLPRIEPLDVESYTGAVGFRRPADWSGRMTPGAGGDSMTEELFVRTWGNLPDEPLTLSGATRFLHTPAIVVRTGPQIARISVQPEVSLDLGPGRIEVAVAATLVQETGRTYQVEVAVPAGLTVTRVEADGLTDWSRTPEGLRLRFDGAWSKQRSVRIQGWLPVPYNPLATGAASEEVTVPWPHWIDVEAASCTLNIEAPTPFQLESLAGVSLLPAATAVADPAAAAAAMRAPRIRRSYRVDRAEGLGRLRWEIEPPRVDVQVRSQVTIHPGSAEWVATLRYDVSGGACDTLLLKMPTAWASAAEVKMVGESCALTSESRGGTTALTIRPRHPIWGAQRVVVRSTRPISGRGSLVFPDLVPTVHGAVETDLAIVNASGREIVPEGSPGLQPIDDAAQFRAEEFWPLLGLPTSVYRVKSEGWSLKVETPGAALPSASGPAGPGQVRATLASIECNLQADGSALGSLRCQVETRSGPFLPLSLPEGSVPLWASVNDAPVRPLRTTSGGWLIPVDARGAGEVVLVWASTPGHGPAAAGRSVPLPVLDQAGVPLFVSIRTPETATVTSRSRVLEPSSPDWQDLAAAEWLGQVIVERISSIDRSSLREREALVSSLVNFELGLRSADRAAALVSGASRTLSTSSDRLERIRQRTRAARLRVAEALESVGLDDLAKAARIHLGLPREDLGRPMLEIPEPTVPVRIRRLGLPWGFQGESAGGAPAASLAWSVAPPHAFGDREDPWTWILGAVAIPSLAWGLVSRSDRLGRPGLGIIALALAATALGGPWMLGAALAMTALGWSATRSSV